MQARPDIIGNGAEIFAHHARLLRLLEHHPQICLARAPIHLAVVPRRIIARIKLRRESAGARSHFFVGERQEFLVSSWAPREGVDAVKAEHVIDPEDVKYLAHPPHSPTPPIELSRPHYVPAGNRNA